MDDLHLSQKENPQWNASHVCKIILLNPLRSCWLRSVDERTYMWRHGRKLQSTIRPRHRFLRDLLRHTWVNWPYKETKWPALEAKENPQHITYHACNTKNSSTNRKKERRRSSTINPQHWMLAKAKLSSLHLGSNTKPPLEIEERENQMHIG